MIGAQGSGVPLISKTMMLLYRDRAAEAVKAKQYVQARNLLTKGRAYLPDAPELDAIEKMLIDAQQSVLRKREYERRDERIAGTKLALMTHAAAGRPEEAAQILESLRAKLPGDDPFITDSAQPAVAAAFLQSAESNRAGGDIDVAVAQLERALAVSPTPEVRKNLARYRDERTHAVLTSSMSRNINSSASLDVAALQAGMVEHQQRYPEEHAALEAELATLATARLISQANTNSLNSEKMRHELDALKSLFPDSGNALETEVTTAIEHRSVSLAATDVYSAYDYVASALKLFPGNRTLSELSARLPPREIARVRNDIDAGKLTTAQASLKTARARYASRAEIAKLTAELDARMADARRAYESYVNGVKKRTLRRASQRRAAYAGAQRLWSDNPAFRRLAYREPRPGECAAELAGRGREDAGICFDLIAGGDRGVPMVVVPHGKDIDKPYAIGKYETSIAEFNVFCRQSGECRPLPSREPQVPVTGVSRLAAERYARWLSEQATSSNGDRVVYRLPTDSEWQHAAGAGGDRVTRGINCRPSGKVDIETGLLAARSGSVSLGMPLGRALVSVTFGEENGWGIVNPVGNAQEWVVTPAGLAARGGAYSDRAKRCTVAFSRSHDGSADELTGFRLLRELN